MNQERDEKGKFSPKGKENREHVIRVTPSELKALQEAREKGIDPKKVLVETVKKDSG